jgi:16S rRNA (uracil1498-N3)-methyltransferase
VRRRFFVEQFIDRTAAIEGETAHHLGRVLRAQVGQLYELSDGVAVWLGRIESVARDRIQFALLEEIPAHPPAVDIVLLLSVVKFDAFEWAIEKATELGVGMIVPVAASRSEKALLAAAGKRLERWEKILVEASQQSRRVRVPCHLIPVATSRSL